jgi:putative flippase GtrA
MFFQFVRFVGTGALAALVYVLLTLSLVEAWRAFHTDVLMPWQAVLLNGVGLFLGMLAAYVMHRRWVFQGLRTWWRYVAFMTALFLASELVMVLLLNILALPYPLILVTVTTVAALVAFALCRGGKIV